MQQQEFDDFYFNELVLKPHKVEKFIEMIKIIIATLDANHIDYWIYAGTLLGAVRNKGFIPWDDDFDIIILKKDEEKLKTLFDGWEEKGIILHKWSLLFGGWYQLHDQRSRQEFDYLLPFDIFIYSKAENGWYEFDSDYWKNLCPGRYLSYEELYPPVLMPFNSLLLKAPNQYHNYFLSCKFGDYMNEIKIVTHNEELNKRVREFPIELYKREKKYFVGQRCLEEV